MKDLMDREKLGAAFSWRTALYLFGGMLLGLAAGFSVHGLPMHVPETTKNVLSAIPTVGVITASGAFWGRSLGRLLDPARLGRFTAAGGLAFGPAILLSGIVLTLLEVILIEQGAGSQMKIHLLYTLLFVPATMLTAATGALAIGLAAVGLRPAIDMARRAGLAAGLGFLAINLAMDAIGWRVGAPGAAARATMLTVTAAGALAAALAGGWALGRAFSADDSTGEV